MANAKVIIGKAPRVKINISTKYTSAQRRLIARDIIAYIIERTRRGLGKDARPWKGRASQYSDSYKKSLEFKIGGKSPGKVDLTLSSEMLDSIDLKSQGIGSITIGVDESQGAKAEGNIKGTYGKKSPIRGKARNFFELSQRELREILADYPITRAAQREARSQDAEAQSQDQQTNDILGDILGES
jgi:hypothetical protein